MLPQEPEGAASPLAGLVNLDRYPLHQLEAEAGRVLVERCKSQLAEDGCAILQGFVHETARERLKDESERLAPLAHFNRTETNPYNCAGDPQLSPEHPMNRFADRTNGFVAGDRIDGKTIIRRLYRDADFQGFVSRVVGIEPIYPYADPLADLVVNVLREGCQHPWHYDTNEFVVSMMTRKPDGGGEFQYAPGIRSPDGENFEGVQAVLDGDGDEVKTLDLSPGDLQIFFGRYSLHRVRRVEGPRERHTVIFAYAKEPGLYGRPERAQRIFGRMAPVHYEMLDKAVERADKLAD